MVPDFRRLQVGERRGMQGGGRMAGFCFPGSAA